MQLSKCSAEDIPMNNKLHQNPLMQLSKCSAEDIPMNNKLHQNPTNATL
jgi:hypothetical protein